MLNILILYDVNSAHVNTTYEHLLSFQLFSKHNVYYSTACNASQCNFNLLAFDVIIIHYSIRVCFNWHFAPEFATALKKYRGFKILFTQDEYENTENIRLFIENYQINLVFTCVPTSSIEKIYPVKRFPSVHFMQNLTGYVPIHYKQFENYITPISQRSSYIGYRGRSLAFWYGKLCQEKGMIGTIMKEICDQKSIPVDIETQEVKRIYGKEWYTFISTHKATLGTESGCNIFDDEGALREAVQLEIKKNPSITFEEIFEKYLKKHEGKVMMNQISPRVFESITFKTALILFEGSYSEVIIPNIHYIPLKKDFSNIDEVLEKLQDDAFLQKMVDKAYDDIILSQKYSYNTFIKNVDMMIDQLFKPNPSYSRIDILLESLDKNIQNQGGVTLKRMTRYLKKLRNFDQKFFGLKVFSRSS